MSELPKKITERRNTFKKLQLMWFLIHYFCGVLAVIFGVLVAASSNVEFLSSLTWLWGLLAAFLSGVITFLDPMKNGVTYKTAYYVLDSAIVKYDAQIYETSDLIAAFDQAQNIVLTGNHNPQDDQ